MTRAAYHAGCLSGTLASDNDRAARAVAARVGVELAEIDWSCAGGAAALTGGPEVPRLAGTLNLSKAAEAGAQRLATGCTACLRHVESAAGELARPERLPDADPEVADWERRAGGVGAGALHELLIEAVLGGAERAVPARPLKGVKLAAYYGCRAFRDGAGAPRGGRWGRAIEEALEWAGATAVAWSGRGECNGGYLTLSRSDVVEERTSLILHEAREAGAEGLVITCGMCRFNLTHRPMDDAMPLLYVPQMLGVALGIEPGELGLGAMHAGRRLLARHGVFEGAAAV